MSRPRPGIADDVHEDGLALGARLVDAVVRAAASQPALHPGR